ncbi:hypothetical protein [Lentzea sp. NPDC060358]|uniref:hypothetical protein n=1 Tax=Lentzea sp. NPDC060358 TaxID=3347103 RepID=UPI0036684552
MRRTTTFLLPLLALTSACATPPSPGGTTSSAPPTNRGGATPVVQVPGIPPKPDAATQAAYVADLDAIDREIVNGNADRAVSRGRDQCMSVAKTPGDQAKLVELTAQRFTSPNHPAGFGPEVSARVLAAVRKHLCPGY